MSPEKLTRAQYKEAHSIEELPDPIRCSVLGCRVIPQTPFYRARLTGGFSLLLPDPDPKRSSRHVRKEDRLIIYVSECRSPYERKVNIVSEKNVFISTFTIDETQVIPDSNWDKEAPLLINDSRNNKESWKERNRWERFKKRQESKVKEENPNWFRDLNNAVAAGLINDGNFF